MSVADLPDEQFFEYLDHAKKIFAVFDMKLCSIITEEIKDIIQKTIPHIDKQKLESKFHDLQDTLEVEFSKKGEYQKKVIKHIQGKYRVTLKTNLNEMQNTFEVSSRYEKTSQRMHSWHAIELLRKITVKGSKDEPEEDHMRLIGISYAYLGLVNGVYRFSLQDCYAWERLANGEAVDPETLKNLEVNDVLDYFKTQNKPLLYFEGLDSTVRNAVGHSNFQYDKVTQKMIYTDEIPREMDTATGILTNQKHESKYSFDEMFENYLKLESVYYAIILLNEILMISAAGFTLTNRYPTT